MRERVWTEDVMGLWQGASAQHLGDPFAEPQFVVYPSGQTRPRTRYPDWGARLRCNSARQRPGALGTEIRHEAQTANAARHVTDLRQQCRILDTAFRQG